MVEQKTKLKEPSLRKEASLRKPKGEPCEDWFFCEDYDELGDIACFLCVCEGCEHDEVDDEEVGV